MEDVRIRDRQHTRAASAPSQPSTSKKDRAQRAGASVFARMPWSAVITAPSRSISASEPSIAP
jgi:hypothetical protein